MTGTIFSVVEAIRPRPPKKIKAAKPATKSPVYREGMPKAFWKATAMELDCTMLPMNPRAMMMEMEKKMARGRQCRPFVM